MCDPVDLHEGLVQVPIPMPVRTHRLDPLATDLSRDHRTEPASPMAHRLVAHFDAPLMQQVFDVPKGEWEADAEHHRRADDLAARLEVAKAGASGYLGRLAGRPAPPQAGLL